MAEAGNTGGKGAAHIGIDQGHFSRLIVVLVVHVLDQVQHIDVQACQPIHHNVIPGNNFVIIQVLCSDGGIVRANLLMQLFVHTAVDGIQQALAQVGTCAEELHLLAGLGCGNAAADGVVVAPDRLHHIVVLVLDGGSLDRDLGGVILKGLGQSRGVQNGQVRLRCGAHVFQGMQEAEVGLGDHGAAIHADAANFQGSPHGVAAEQLVVAGDTGKLDHAELHGQVVDQFLGLGLGQDALIQVALDVDIQEGGDTANAHGSAVLGLDGSQIAKVQPLHSLLGVGSGQGDIIAVSSGHGLHIVQGADLQGDLFTQTDDVIGHGAVTAVGKVVLLFFDQVVNAVQGNAAVVANDAAAAIGIGQAGHNVAVACLFHLRGVGIKHSGVVGAGILGKDFVQLRGRSIAIGGAGLFCHLDAAIGHEGALEGLIGLQADDFFQILQVLADIAGAVSGHAGNHFSLHIQNAALGALFLLQNLQSTPKLIGCFGGAGKEAFIAGVGAVVLLDKIAGVDFFFPDAALEAFPLYKICHRLPPVVNQIRCSIS